MWWNYREIHDKPVRMEKCNGVSHTHTYQRQTDAISMVINLWWLSINPFATNKRVCMCVCVCELWQNDMGRQACSGINWIDNNFSFLSFASLSELSCGFSAIFCSLLLFLSRLSPYHFISLAVMIHAIGIFVDVFALRSLFLHHSSGEEKKMRWRWTVVKFIHRFQIDKMMVWYVYRLCCCFWDLRLGSSNAHIETHFETTVTSKSCQLAHEQKL